ncbi:hypothetical protein [Scytonema sp. PCC 10023]|uniref:hypothetical protein n=1 Tax=Scytonema sp. PCC 10023 TaxID=1680591 RepID=UPI0039C68182
MRKRYAQNHVQRTIRAKTQASKIALVDGSRLRDRHSDIGHARRIVGLFNG